MPSDLVCRSAEQSETKRVGQSQPVSQPSRRPAKVCAPLVSSPTVQENEQVGAVDHAVAIEIVRAVSPWSRTRPPLGKKRRQIGRWNDSNAIRRGKRYPIDKRAADDERNKGAARQVV